MYSGVLKSLPDFLSGTAQPIAQIAYGASKLDKLYHIYIKVGN